MKPVRTVVAMAVAVAATTAPAVTAIQVVIGTNWVDGHTNNVAWQPGRPCGVLPVLSTHPANPCGVWFSMGGYHGLSLEGCGGSKLWLNHQGRWLASCRYGPGHTYECADGRRFTDTYFCG